LNTSLGILGAATHGRGAWEILTGTPTTTTTTTTVSAAAGQYSDGVTLKATVSPVGAGGSVGFLVNGSAIPGSATYDSTTGIATQSYAITQGQGTYQIKAIFAPSTSSFTGSTGTNSLVVSREDAVITPSPANPNAVKANTPGGTAGPITVTATIVEKADDTTQGNTSLAVPVTCTLNPLLPGATYTVTATTRGGGIGGTLTATCLFASVTVNTYLFVTSIGGNYYTGSSQSLLAVYDPSLGFVTGSGTITRNGNLAEFGFNAKYSSNGTLLANVLYVEHQPTGDVVVQSVATQSLSIIENLAAIVTKGVVNGTGDYTLITTVTDNGEPGINLDLFGLEVRDSSGAIVSGLTFPKTRIIRGNIQVHSSKRNN